MDNMPHSGVMHEDDDSGAMVDGSNDDDDDDDDDSVSVVADGGHDDLEGDANSKDQVEDLEGTLNTHHQFETSEEGSYNTHMFNTYLLSTYNDPESFQIIAKFQLMAAQCLKARSSMQNKDKVDSFIKSLETRVKQQVSTWSKNQAPSIGNVTHA